MYWIVNMFPVVELRSPIYRVSTMSSMYTYLYICCIYACACMKPSSSTLRSAVRDIHIAPSSLLSALLHPSSSYFTCFIPALHARLLAPLSTLACQHRFPFSPISATYAYELNSFSFVLFDFVLESKYCECTRACS